MCICTKDTHTGMFLVFTFVMALNYKQPKSSLVRKLINKMLYGNENQWTSAILNIKKAEISQKVLSPFNLNFRNRKYTIV